MPSIYPPGSRKNNRYWIVRGSINGEPYEVQAKEATNRRGAERYWKEFEAGIRARGGPKPGAPETFSEVADIYADTKNVSKAQRGYIDKIKRELGQMHIADIEQMHIDVAASRLYPGAKNATKNRQVYAPTAAVLHYAAKSKLRDYIQVSKLRETDPPTRRPSPHVRDLLLANTEGPKRALLTFLFFQGWRIGETLGLQAENIDLHRRTLRLYVSKAGKWKEVPMHDATFEVLASMHLPDTGRLWPWRTRDGVYKWLRPVCDRLRITFTPHMARHEFGGFLRSEGATNRDLVDVNTWTSERSVSRYTSGDSDHAREIIGRLNRGAKSGGSGSSN